MCMNGKREAACLKKMRIRARGGEEKTRVYYTHACVFLEKVFKEKLLRPDRDVSFAEMDGAPVRFFVLLSLHYTTFVNHEWVSDASMRASGVSSFFSPLSLSLQAVIRSKGSTEKLRHAPRQVPIDIEQVREPSLFLSLEIKGVFSLFLSFVDNWKGYYREEMEVENRKSAILEETRVAFETVILIFQTRSRGGLEEPRKGRNYEEEGDEEARLSMCCTVPSERKNVKNLILIWIRSLPTRFSNSQRG